uniref:Coatomer subunit zeta n=1 Tax=Timema californicum TaxID=61474 RepID=A0A7R9P3N6_TIMCA|nr:unnamed protein product [Timema californicum]
MYPNTSKDPDTDSVSVGPWCVVLMKSMPQYQIALATKFISLSSYYSNPMASLVLTDSSQLTSDSQRLAVSQHQRSHGATVVEDMAFLQDVDMPIAFPENIGYVLLVSCLCLKNCVKEPTLYTVKGMAILDNDGNRILAKYYDKNVFPTAKEQKTFEKNLFNKTHRANAEIIMLDGLTCVYRSNVDLFFYVMGSSHENELILMSVLNCLYDSVSHILRKNVEKRVVLENLDIVMLAMDEICDGG